MRTLGSTKGTHNERDALAQGDEADHHGDDRRQQTNDLIENAGKHAGGYDLTKDRSGSSRGNGISLCNPSFPKIQRQKGETKILLCAGDRIRTCSFRVESPTSKPLDRPAIYPDQKKIRKNL